MKQIILAIVSGVLAGSGFAGLYTNYENFRSYENDGLIYRGIIILHWIALLLAVLIAKPYLSMDRTEQVIPFIVIFLTALVTMGIWIFI